MNIDLNTIGKDGGLAVIVGYCVMRLSALESRVDAIMVHHGLPIPKRKVAKAAVAGVGTALALGAAHLLSGCTVTKITKKPDGQVTFTSAGPAYPWQDSQKHLDRLRLNARGTNFTASMDGLDETETTSTNAVRLFEAGIGAAVNAAVKATK